MIETIERSKFRYAHINKAILNDAVKEVHLEIELNIPREERTSEKLSAYTKQILEALLEGLNANTAA